MRAITVPRGRPRVMGVQERTASDEQSYLNLLERGEVAVPFCDWRDCVPETDPETAAWVEALRAWAEEDSLNLYVYSFCNVSFGDTIVELARPNGEPYLRRRNPQYPSRAAWLQAQEKRMRKIEAEFGETITAARTRAKERVAGRAHPIHVD